MPDDGRYYARRAEDELRLAAGARDRAVKAVHLDMASRYATLRERASAPHRTDGTTAEAADDVSATVSGPGGSITDLASGDRTVEDRGRVR
jgi:hypothetical protein